MKYLIIGGSKSGKSGVGERIALSLNKNKVIYIATMKPYDTEDEKRIENHIKNRHGLGFVTLEKYRDLDEILKDISEEDTILIDSLTSLLTNEMFVENDIIKTPSSKILHYLNEIMNKAKNVVIISDYIFNDAIEYDCITENFKRELGKINTELVRVCENVIECSFNNVKYHKAYEIK
ncbi:bifunctional adenosylcobinamide kinase/adenosylcobinamide-phosphate guanylyltransferase [Clostridium uliginosum]|uniref:Adenosylcobinamide kinase n=1 Tax=Clostridium uliginosum TaxID=119641 RepID=A0A1I1NXN0_9CLOT|nr:bifunctional adenosylcobinamide kinase/adenosylcobinamide-phosphate guanylyltransferase [Clostridium uliginosum]SFD02451.1 adenosylcobinamide kinase / adenosylcobinamide-phosphate guanylyltransferase [Clostridium uliginosum]